MALSSVTYTTSGVGPYAIPFHVPRADLLVVTLDAVELDITDDWTVDSGILNLTLVNTSTGAELVIARVTPLADADLPVTFTNGAPITKANLDDAVHDLNHKLQEASDRIDTVDGEDGEDGQGFTWLGTWSSLTTYAAYDVVEYNGSSYVALQSTLNDAPDVSPSDWELVAEKGDDGASGAGDESLIFMGL